jgi:tetratricopeptide (TPR) repeat protein
MDSQYLLKLTLLLLALNSCAGDVRAMQKKEEALPSAMADLRQAQADVRNLTRQMEAIHRDQLNYRIEKDLLKDSYSSNLQGINLAITIVFGVFGVLGYAGMRSIKDIRADYGNELDKLRDLKNSFEVELKSLTLKQREFEAKVAELAQVNDKQDRRLKVMELTEKIGSLLKAKSYRWALEHVFVGLSLDENNAILLTMKAVCCGKLGRLSEAISTCKQLIMLEPANISHQSNLLEFLSLAAENTEFNDHYAKYKTELDERFDGGMTIYFKSILALMRNDFAGAKAIFSTYVQSQPPEAKQRLEGWSFEDALAVAKPLGDGPRKRLLLALIGYFKGDVTQADLNTEYEGV